MFLTAPRLGPENGLLHAFCTRRGGVSPAPFAGLNLGFRTEDAPENVAANLAIASRCFRIPPERFAFLEQVHGSDVLVVSEGREKASQTAYLPGSGAARPGAGSPFLPLLAAGRPCDAVATDREGVALCIRTADCVPIFLADPVRRAIAVVHAGWRGSALEIAGRAVECLVTEFSCRPENLRAAIGPAIGPCCYEVDRPVEEALGNLPGAGAYLRKGGRPGQWRLDLPGLNRWQLLQRGVRREQIFLGRICTACRGDLFFSHRRDGGSAGRHLNFLMMIKNGSGREKKLDVWAVIV